MNNLLKVSLLLTGLPYHTLAFKFNIDTIEFGCNSTDTDVIDCSGKTVSPSRGVFEVVGTMEIKQDIDTDSAILEENIFYSPNGITYQLSPFRIPQQSATAALNLAYKNYLMNTMVECCTNALNIVDKFVSPLTKRFVKCENCVFPNDNLPTVLRLGFYRLVLTMHKPDFTVWVLLKVEMD